jgi:2-keto-4-pentenoate hydratase
MKTAVLAAGALAVLLSAPVAAECLSDAQVAQLAAAFEARKPAVNPEGLSTADGECSRAKFNALLQARMGLPIGYKAGLTNPAVQKRFNHDAPVRGTLYAPMLLADGASVEPAFGARPLFEADLLVRISDAAINGAKTPEDVLRSIDQVIPFIELPDLVVAAPPKLNGAAIIAINVGARLGVIGKPVPVQRDAAFADALRDMQVVVRGDGAELDRGKGSDVLEHPLNAVVWLVGDLRREGLYLKPGDLISLGSFSKLLPPKPGLAVEVEYQGLPGNPRVGMSFKR